MSRRSEGRVWARARAVARALAPADRWRERLASTLLELPEVASVWLFTCPPGLPFAAHGVALPAPDAHQVSQAFLTRFQPALERDGFSARWVKRFGCAPHAALDLSDVGLSSRVRRLLLPPLGAVDVVHAFLVIDEDQVVGWLSLCTRTRAATVLRRAGTELAEISRLVSQSLAHALRVAESCGARPPRLPSMPRRRLSKRETEIALLVGRGLSDLNIAHRLGISEHTVAAHLRSIFGKLELHSRVELATYAPLLGAGEGKARG